MLVLLADDRLLPFPPPRRRLPQLSGGVPVHEGGTSDTMICGAPNYVQVGRKSRVTGVLDQVARIFSAAADGQVGLERELVTS
jgi:hypothetical protein